MKVKLYVHSILLAALSLNIGCVSSVTDLASNAYNSTTRKFTNNNTQGTDALYAQVAQEDKAQVDQLNHQLKVAEQQKVIAKLVTKRDDLQRERSRINSKRTELITSENTYRVQLAKLEAIDRNQLGDKISNIETIADTHVDALEVQQKRLKLDKEVGVLDVKIDKLEQQIEKENNTLDNLQNKQLTTSL